MGLTKKIKLKELSKTIKFCVKCIFDESKLYVAINIFDTIFSHVRSPILIFLRANILFLMSQFVLKNDEADFNSIVICVALYCLISYAIHPIYYILAGYFRNKESIVKLNITIKYRESLINNIDMQEYEMPEYKTESGYISGMPDNIFTVFISTLALCGSIIEFGLSLWLISSVSAILIIPIFLCLFVTSKIQKHFTIKKNQLYYTSIPMRAWTFYAYKILTTDEYAEETKIFNSRDYFISLWKTNAKETNDGNLKLEKKMFPLNVLFNIINTLGAIICIIFATVKVILLNVSIAQISIAYDTSNNIFAHIYNINSQYGVICDKCIDLNRAIALIENIENNNTKLDNIDNINEIRFENVSFSYMKNDIYALKNLSFTLKSGDYIALVGKNGSGKTTLCMLLSGLYRPTSGIIYYNGIPHYDISPQKIQQLSAVMFQDYQKYAMSVSDNITFNEKNMVNENRLSHVINNSNIKDFSDNLVYGLNTQLLPDVIENASNLSIGQWQRIACARNFYKKGDMLLMDEPSSALDTFSENQMYDSIKLHDEIHIKVIVTHQLSSVKNTSRIIMLENGSIKYDSDYEKLIEYDNDFSKYYKIKADKYIIS